MAVTTNSFNLSYIISENLVNNGPLSPPSFPKALQAKHQLVSAVGKTRHKISGSYYENKVWSFQNDNICSAEALTPDDVNVDFIFDHDDVTNSGFTTFGVTDLDEDSFTGGYYTFNCSQP